MLYRIISDNEKSLTAFEKLKEIGSQNPNFLRNYPIELIQTHANLSNAEKEVILNYFRKFLSIYPEDNIIHDAYYVTWLNTDECKATEEIERLPFVKQNLRSKILLINVYVKHFEIDKAEKLIENLEFQFSDCSELNIARKNLLVHKKNLPEAIKECEKALEKCKDKLYRLDIIKDLLRLELSVQNLQLSQIGKLVELINSVENKYERLNLYGYELVYCRMYQKKNEEAIKVIKQIRSFGLIKSEIVSEEIFINFTTRNYQKVLELFKEFDALKGVRGERENKIYIWSLLGLGEDEKVKNAVEYLDLSGKPEEYVFASQQLLNLGKPELSIKLAHEGYLKYHDNVKVVEQFFASIFSAAHLPVNFYKIWKFITFVAEPFFRILSVDSFRNSLICNSFRQRKTQCFALGKGCEKTVYLRLAYACLPGNFPAGHVQSVMLVNDVFVIEHTLTSINLEFSLPRIIPL